MLSPTIAALTAFLVVIVMSMELMSTKKSKPKSKAKAKATETPIHDPTLTYSEEEQ